MPAMTQTETVKQEKESPFNHTKLTPQIEVLCGGNVSSEETDSALGAHLLYHMSKHCANCGTPDTPLWRKGWHDNILGHSLSLCNACGLKYAKKQYCPYCMFVYKINVDVHSHRSDWVACSNCPRWVHVECEKKYGNMSTSGFTPYQCPDCRIIKPVESSHTVPEGEKFLKGEEEEGYYAENYFDEEYEQMDE